MLYSVAKYLNKTGLQTYNDSLPHSSAQMQGYVNDWLNEHPEATTTVEDGAIDTNKLADGAVTTPKLADGVVTQNKLAPDVKEAIENSSVANALMGIPYESTWLQRESTGIGMAIVESVQGATEVHGGALVPVRIAGIASEDANGGELDSVEWGTQILRAAGSVRDVLYNNHIDVRVGVTTVTGANDWRPGSAAYDGNLATDRYVSISGAIPDANPPHPINVRVTDFTTTAIPQSGIWSNPDAHVNECRMNGVQLHICFSNELVGITTDMTATQRTEAIKTWLNSHPQEVWFELATPTTVTITPALQMSYKIEQGGTEHVIVPIGETSATPVIIASEGESGAELVMDALACIAAPDGPIATSNHSINTYLTMNGKLYKVTRAIAVGETVAIGTNVTQTTVMDELIARTA